MGSGAPSTVRCQGSEARPAIAPTTSVRTPSGPASTRRRSAGPTRIRESVRAASARPIQARARRCPRARCTSPPGRPPRGRARNGRWNPAGDSIVCTPKLVSPSWARTFRIDPRKVASISSSALTRRACYRALPLIVLWWCRFAAPAGRLGPGWCNLNKGCSRVCSPPTWWPCSSARRSARLRPRRSTTTPTPANRFWELLDAAGPTNRAGLCSSRDRELTDYGVGLTDLVKVRGASSDGLLESSDYDRSGCIASDRARAPADAIVRVARLRPTKAIPVLNLGVPA